MGLSTPDKIEAKRQMLSEAKISERYFNRSLSTAGKEGEQLRDYMKTDMKAARLNSRGLIFVSEKANIAQCFARDMVLLKTGVRFSYLQTFAMYHGSDEFKFKGHTLEWFEQAGQPSPFTPKERYSLETEILRMVDAGVIFYLFTQVPPTSSEWWSRSFWDAMLENNEILIGGKNGNRESSERTTISNSSGKGRKGSKPNQRVTVR